MAKLRWGVLSTSRFARTKILPALQNCLYAEAAAIASRDLAKAQAAAAHFRIAKAYGMLDRSRVMSQQRARSPSRVSMSRTSRTFRNPAFS